VTADRFGAWVRIWGTACTVAVLTLLAAALTGAPNALGAAPEGLIQVARLQGQFTASGTVTQSVGVPGELRGEHVTRTWTFVPTCPTGACATVQLTRQRGASAHDTLLLHRQRPGYYAGTTTFTVPMRCSGRVYAAGERARYTITLTITSATASGNTVQAAGFTATYRNPARTGLTSCYTAPAHDSARYVGAPAPPAPPAPGG
jgi:hypothetical protein